MNKGQIQSKYKNIVPVKRNVAKHTSLPRGAVKVTNKFEKKGQHIVERKKYRQ